MYTGKKKKERKKETNQRRRFLLRISDVPQVTLSFTLFDFEYFISVSFDTTEKIQEQHLKLFIILLRTLSWLCELPQECFLMAKIQSWIVHYTHRHVFVSFALEQNLSPCYNTDSFKEPRPIIS